MSQAIRGYLDLFIIGSHFSSPHSSRTVVTVYTALSMETQSSNYGRTPTSMQIPKENTFPDRGKKNRLPSTQTTSSVRFACPFLKANPRQMQPNSVCVRHTWPSIARLKEHLYRRHAQPKHSCPRCAASFEKEKDLGDHLRTETPCKLTRSDDRPVQTISPVQIHLLRRRKGQYGENEVDKWFEIFSILFPDQKPPGSPYAGSRGGLWGWDIHIMDELQEFVAQHASASATETLGREALPPQGCAEIDHRIKRIISDCVSDAFEQYRGQPNYQQPRCRADQEPEQNMPESVEMFDRPPASVISTVSRTSTPMLMISPQSTGLSDCTDFGVGADSNAETLNSVATMTPTQIYLEPLEFPMALTGPQKDTTGVTRVFQPQAHGLQTSFSLSNSNPSEESDSHGLSSLDEMLSSDWCSPELLDPWEVVKPSDIAQDYENPQYPLSYDQAYPQADGLITLGHSP